MSTLGNRTPCNACSRKKKACWPCCDTLCAEYGIRYYLGGRIASGRHAPQGHDPVG